MPEKMFAGRTEKGDTEMTDSEINKAVHEAMGLKPEIKWDNSKCGVHRYLESDGKCTCVEREFYPAYTDDARLFWPLYQELNKKDCIPGQGHVCTLTTGRDICLAWLRMKEEEKKK